MIVVGRLCLYAPLTLVTYDHAVTCFNLCVCFICHVQLSLSGPKAALETFIAANVCVHVCYHFHKHPPCVPAQRQAAFRPWSIVRCLAFMTLGCALTFLLQVDSAACLNDTSGLPLRVVYVAYMEARCDLAQHQAILCSAFSSKGHQESTDCILYASKIGPEASFFPVSITVRNKIGTVEPPD